MPFRSFHFEYGHVYTVVQMNVQNKTHTYIDIQIYQ